MPLSRESRAAYEAQPRQRYEQHRRNAALRGIAFLLTFEEWWAWWQEDGRWEKRGRRGGALVMARKGDVGPYSLENIYCATQQGNLADIPAEVKTSARAQTAVAVKADNQKRVAAGTHHLQVRGDGHPRAKAVITPKGRFGSAALAAEAHGISPSAATRKATAGWKGWRYEAG